MEKKKQNKDYTATLKEQGAGIYEYLGRLLKKADDNAIEIERLKVLNDTARQGFNNGSLAMRACRYDYDVKRLELDFRRQALAEKKFEREQADKSMEGL